MHGVRCPDERGHPSNYYKATTRDRAFFSFTLCPYTTGVMDNTKWMQSYVRKTSFFCTNALESCVPAHENTY